MFESMGVAIAVGFVAYFCVAWLPQFVRGWIAKGKYRRAKKRAGEEDEWIFRI